MRGRRLIAIVAVALASTFPAAVAVATPVPGATYNGAAADGAAVTFTISPDGTLVTSYQFIGVRGNNCQLQSAGFEGAWPGAPIEQSAFSYQFENLISFDGSFPGPRSASGTFQLHQDAVSGSPACDTGVVNWTATTTATPPPGSGGSGSSGGPGVSGSGTSGSGQGGHRTPTFSTRVILRKPSRKKLNGRVMSPKLACRADRTVYLWRGSRRIASTKSKAGGKFSFAVTAKIRGRAVRASAKMRKVRGGACAAGSSAFIRVTVKPRAAR